MKLFDRITSLEEAMTVPEIAAAARRINSRTDVEYFSFYPESVMFFPYVITTAGSNRKVIFEANGNHSSATEYLSIHLWWLLREHLRFHANKEEYGTVLKNLWCTGHLVFFCPKPNPQDRLKIDFFPDARAAAADRPVTTTMAKFLGKVCPIYSDEYIRDVDAAYRASMGTDVEFLSGKDNLRLAYTTGPHSCMSPAFHDKNNFPAYEGNHPVDMYDVPGINIAVGRDGGGRINARCLCYISPTDPTDKRMIRVYGDMALAGRLARNGFKYKALAGVKLKALPVALPPSRGASEGVRTLVAAYVDGPEGKHDASDAYRTALWLDDDKDHLVFVNIGQLSSIKASLRKMNMPPDVYTNSSNSVGFLPIKPIPRAAVQLRCEFSNKVVDLLDPANAEVEPILIYHEGHSVSALSTPELEAKYPVPAILIKTIGREWSSENVRVTADTPVLNVGSTQIDTPLARAYNGYYRFDPERYPDNTGWYKASNRVASEMVRQQAFGGQGAANTGIDDQTVLIGPWAYKKTDCIKVVDVVNNPLGDQLETRWVANRDMAGLVRVHSIKRGEQLWATKAVKTVKTVTGRLCVPIIHPVVELHDGTWAFRRTVKEANFMGYEFYYLNEKPAVTRDSAVYKRALRGLMITAGGMSRLFQLRASSQEHNERWETSLMQTMHTRIVYVHGGPALAFYRVKEELENPTVSAERKQELLTVVQFYSDLRAQYLNVFNAGYPGLMAPPPFDLSGFAIQPPTLTEPTPILPTPPAFLDTVATLTSAYLRDNVY